MRGYNALQDIIPCPNCRHGCETCDQKGYIYSKAAKNKHGNKKTVVDGITFPSKLEAHYYLHLLLLQRAGIVKEFKLQPAFVLMKSYIDPFTGKKIQPIEYVADFLVTYMSGRIEAQDTKGHKTKDFILKQKLYGSMAKANGWPPLILITHDSKMGWANVEDVKKAERRAKDYAKQAKKAGNRQAKQSSASGSKRGTGTNL